MSDLEKRARQAAQQQRDVAHQDYEEWTRQSHERGTRERAEMAPLAVAHAQKILGVRTSPADWKRYSYMVGGWSAVEHSTEIPGVETVIEGIKLYWCNGKLSDRDDTPCDITLAEFGFLLEKRRQEAASQPWYKRVFH
jgi:hypothetical protein